MSRTGNQRGDAIRAADRSYQLQMDQLNLQKQQLAEIKEKDESKEAAKQAGFESQLNLKATGRNSTILTEGLDTGMSTTQRIKQDEMNSEWKTTVAAAAVKKAADEAAAAKKAEADSAAASKEEKDEKQKQQLKDANIGMTTGGVSLTVKKQYDKLKKKF